MMQSDDVNHDAGRARHQSLSKTLSRQAADESQVYLLNFLFFQKQSLTYIFAKFTLIFQLLDFSCLYYNKNSR